MSSFFGLFHYWKFIVDKNGRYNESVEDYEGPLYLRRFADAAKLKNLVDNNERIRYNKAKKCRSICDSNNWETL